ncbi:MAG TPA: response regulator transcription factor [Ilumatobacteraceae bacterium]|nr:response regulator transcription factor [Ilumatobacteraceae bacterium]
MTTRAVVPDSPSPSPSPPPSNERESPVVLVVEDDIAPLKMMEASISARGYRVVTASTGASALEAVSAQTTDVIIVDLGLPDMDGLELCRHLRLWTKTPIIVVTADGSEERMVQALDEGADDYITKPFSMPELLARIRVAIRHRLTLTSLFQDPTITVGALTIDVEAHEARVSGEPIELPPRQFKLLTMLARNPGGLLTTRHAVQQLWGPETDHSVSHALRVLVSKLRKSLGEGDGVPRIVSEPHIGYRLVESNSD